MLNGVESLPIVLTEFPGLAAKSQGVLNPLIYGATNKMFRQAFYKCLPCSGLSAMLVKKEEEKPPSSVESNSGDENETKAQVS